MTIDLRARETAPSQVSLLDATPRHSPAKARIDHRRWVLVLMAITALACAFVSNASPAGIELADALYRAGFGASVVWFGSRSRRWTWGLLAGLAALSTATLPGQIAAVIALGIAGWSLTIGRRAHLAGAVIAALAMPALLTQGAGPLWRLSGGRIEDPFATSAIITLIATWPVLRSGWRTLSRRRRRRIKGRFRYVGIGVLVVLLGTTAIAAIAVPSMLRGLNNTRLAADYAQSGNLEQATLSFEQATQSWDRSNTILSGPWMVPSRLVPVVGQHVRAAQIASGQASAITNSAGLATERVDPDSLIVDGAVDLDEVDRITPAVDAFAATIDRAAVRIEEAKSPWLIPPVGDRIGRSLEILTPAAGVAGVAAEALHIGSDLLGANNQSRILIMFSTPAEARGAGGFVGNWAVASAQDGRLSIESQFRTRELNALLAERNATLVADSDYVARYERFAIERHIQDVAISPDFPSVAPVAANLFTQATGTEVDAVLSVDPFVIQQLLAFTGPLERSSDTPLTGSNAAQELLVEQYVDFGTDEANREAELAELTTTLVSTLLDSPPDPIAFATELAPLAQQQRISLWIAADFDGSIAERLGLDGAFPRTDHDLFSVVHQNAGQNKIDAFLERTVAVSTELYPETDFVSHDVTITLDNNAPSEGLPDAIIASNDQGLELGTNRMTLSVYSPLGLSSASVDGTPVPVEADTEFGANVYSIVVAIAPEDFRVIDLQLEGEIELDDGYRMNLSSQPLVTADSYSWHVRTADGSRISAPEDWAPNRDGVRWAASLDRDKEVTFSLDG